MTRTDMAAQAPEPRGFGLRGAPWWPVSAPSWMGLAFIIALVLAIIVLVIFGAGERGTELALMRYRASAVVLSPFLARLCWKRDGAGVPGSVFDGLACRGRELGPRLRVGTTRPCWTCSLAPITAVGPGGAMVFFWLGILCT